MTLALSFLNCMKNLYGGTMSLDQNYTFFFFLIIQFNQTFCHFPGIGQAYPSLLFKHH
jgi:hypothetical protein